MKCNPELPIAIGEPFFIHDTKLTRTIPATVVDVKSVENEDWQLVGLRKFGLPHDSFVLNSARRKDFGIYTDRNGRYNFLRLDVLPFEELVKYFNNGSRQLAEAFVRSQQRS